MCINFNILFVFKNSFMAAKIVDVPNSLAFSLGHGVVK